MTYQEFVNKYNGQYVDTDGYPKEWKWQCYDLAQLYFQEVLDVPYEVLQGCQVVKNMILWDWKYNMMMEYFDEVDTRAMQQGDVCIWTSGEGGHIAIYDHYDGVNCWYFSQNPNPCQIMVINLDGHHAFRRKQPAPPTPTPEVTPNVPQDIYKDQIEVLDGITELRVRTEPNTNAKVIGVATPGYYNYYETYQKDINDYLWYKIADNQWLASKEGEWTIAHPKQQPTEPPTQPPEEYIKFKVLDRKDGNVLINVPIWVKE